MTKACSFGALLLPRPIQLRRPSEWRQTAQMRQTRKKQEMAFAKNHLLCEFSLIFLPFSPIRNQVCDP